MQMRQPHEAGPALQGDQPSSDSAQEGRDAEDHPEYVQSSGDGRLRFSEGTWEVGGIGINA